MSPPNNSIIWRFYGVHTPGPEGYAPLLRPKATRQLGMGIYGWDLGLPSCTMDPYFYAYYTMAHAIRLFYSQP